MVEAKVECLCTEYHVVDLGLRLRRGQVEWMDAQRVRSSADMRLAQAAEAVKVTFQKRCDVSRPIWVGKQRVRELRAAAVPPTPPPPPQAPVAAAPSAKDIARELANEFRQVVREEVQAAMSSLPASSALPASRASVRVVADVPEDATPVFIPSNIVPTTGASIEVATTAAGGDGLDEASAALKATKGRKKKGVENGG